MARPRLSPEERQQRRREAALKGVSRPRGQAGHGSGRGRRPDGPGDPRASPRPRLHRETGIYRWAHELRLEPSPRSGPWTVRRHCRGAWTASSEAKPMIVNFEQVNARGEASRPRVDLNALGELLDRAALGVEMLRGRLAAAGESPAPRPRPWKPPSSPPCGKSGRSGRGPAGACPVNAPGDDHDASHRSRFTKLGWPGPRTCGASWRCSPAWRVPPPRRRPPGDGRRPRPARGLRGTVLPGRAAPARPTARPDRGDAWDPPTGEPDEDAPTDGRQLLGWASKQIPDLKGVLIGYGKKKGLRSKIVEWTPQQVAAAYRFARARSTR